MTPPPSMRQALHRLLHSHAAWLRPLRQDAWPEPQAGAYRARQLQALLRLSPLCLLSNIINSVLVVATFWNGGANPWLAPWSLALGWLLHRMWRSWLRWRRDGAQWTTASPHAVRRCTVLTTAVALLWAAVPLLLLRDASGPQQMLIGVVVAGMLCAGGVALSTLPLAAAAYLGILTVASMLALLAEPFALAPPIALLLLCYGLLTALGVLINARLFTEHQQARAEAEHQQQVIGLLLRDFEEHSSDVLWEIDARGHLCHPSARLAALFARSEAALAAQPLLELLRTHVPMEAPDAAAGLARLGDGLARGAPFRDLVLELARDGKTRWWSLTAKPLFDARGERSGWRGVAADVTARHRANRRLSFLAHFDPLTGLSNRLHLRAELEQLLAPSVGAPRAFALLCLDLDHFKSINDTRGHAVGDALLREVGRRLQAHTRRSDTAARLGGDEFVVVLRDVAHAEEAGLLAQRLLDGLHQPCELHGSAIRIRSSMGIALAPRDGQHIDALLGHADLALYAAKSAARGSYRFFAPEMAALTRRRLNIEQALRDALVRGELHLVFQPQLHLQSWQVTGFEALLRWRHPQLGDVSAAEFIPVAEEAGLIQEIGAWVLDQACRHARHWPDTLGVSVNVAPVQAASHELCARVREALNRHGLAPDRLELEITESIFINHAPASFDVLRALRELGVRIALDDFGTGHSSLAYLRRFPFDTLKIDSAFVRELLTRRDARAIVKTVVGLASTLHINTVAEGVEDPAQVEVLTRYGCKTMQGYFGARPMSPDEIGPFLAAWDPNARPPRQETLLTGPVVLA